MKLKKIPDFFKNNIDNFHWNELIKRFYKSTINWDIKELSNLYSCTIWKWPGIEVYWIYSNLFDFWGVIDDQIDAPLTEQKEKLTEELYKLVKEVYIDNIKEYLKVQKRLFLDIEKELGCSILDKSINKILVIDGILFQGKPNDWDYNPLYSIFSKKDLNDFYREDYKPNWKDKFTDIYYLNKLEDILSSKEKGIKNFIFVFENWEMKTISMDFLKYINWIQLKYLDYYDVNNVNDFKNCKIKKIWYCEYEYFDIDDFKLDYFFCGYFNNLDFSTYLGDNDYYNTL